MNFPKEFWKVTAVRVGWVISALSKRAIREGFTVLYTYVAMAVVIHSKMYAMRYARKTHALQMVRMEGLRGNSGGLTIFGHTDRFL